MKDDSVEDWFSVDNLPRGVYKSLWKKNANSFRPKYITDMTALSARRSAILFHGNVRQYFYSQMEKMTV